MKILALCGSLRENSSHSVLLRILRQMLPPETEWNVFAGQELPYFDPALQFSDTPEKVQQLRSFAATADYLIISTPEYAHGIPGLLKNTLEWLICEESMQKKVVILTGSPSGGEFALAALCETLQTMDLQVSPQRTLRLPLLRQQLRSDGTLDENLRQTLLTFIRSLNEDA